MRKIFVIAHDMRSMHNVGSLLRTAEGLGVDKLFLTGYTPHPSYDNDTRLPHISLQQTKQISKTSLGAENSLDWEYHQDLNDIIRRLREQGVMIVALEQTKNSIPLPDFKPPDSIAVILGTEVTGLTDEVISLTDKQVIIPMFGKKESYNVVQAAAMALYSLRFC